MTASDQLNALINDAYRNHKPEVFAALKLLRDTVAELESRLEKQSSVLRAAQGYINVSVCDTDTTPEMAQKWEEYAKMMDDGHKAMFGHLADAGEHPFAPFWARAVR